jgi:hypothetical protein
MTSSKISEALRRKGVSLAAATVRDYWGQGAPRDVRGFLRFYRGRTMARARRRRSMTDAELVAAIMADLDV